MMSSESENDKSRQNNRKKKIVSLTVIAGSISALGIGYHTIGSLFSYSQNSVTPSIVGTVFSVTINNIFMNDDIPGSTQIDVSSIADDKKGQNSNSTAERKCFWEDNSVPCDTSHNSEVITGISNCDSGELVRYLGGIANVDTFSPGISYELNSNNSSECKVTFPVSLRESIEGKWREPSLRQLPELRSCFNPDRADSIVGCNELHTGEVVYSQSGSDGTNLLCDMKAADYMDSDKEKWQDTLKTEEVEYNGSWLCVAKTRNNNLLDSTLRSLRTRKIETKPRQ